MKYWNELSKIEDSIIRLSSLDSLLRVIAAGIPSTNLEDAENAVWYLQGTVEDIHEKLRNDFSDLWNVVLNESLDSPVANGESDD
jgi:hypothetical protein